MSTNASNKFKKFFFHHSTQKEYEYIPSLTNDQMNLIGEKQAQFIYENGINVLKDLEKGVEKLKAKADKIFQYSLSIASGLGFLFFARKDFILQSHHGKEFFLSALVIIFSSIAVYFYSFVLPKDCKSTYNLPQATIGNRALKEMKVLYIIESIEMQKFTIPFNLQQMVDMGRGLKIIFFLLTLCAFLFFSFIIYSLR